ncbi:MAG TPA: GAF domain-containing protein, partial [Streptosporangiaceae bacterium]|nr:GAF domain-containing protein [Streptosporangiaceae bacterium]
PLVALLAYHWNWRYAVLAALLQLACVYYFFLPPLNTLKPLTLQSATELVTLAAVTGLLLAIVQLARRRRALAERAAGRFAALGRVGTALAGELAEERLLQQIAATARELTGAGFAAFTLRPLNELGRPLVPAEGHLFHLAAVVGVTKGQEALFRRMPLGGEGLLAPIFRHGVAVRVADALAHTPEPEQTAGGQPTAPRDAARQAAFDYAHGQLSKEGLRSMGVPRGHPVVRSFLGVPLLDRTGEVRGGLLLGHSEPEQFTQADEDVLVGLAAQAAVALENARLYHAAQVQAQELDAIFESIADGVTLVDDQGGILRENSAARRMREAVQASPEGGDVSEALLHRPAERALQGAVEPSLPVTLVDAQQELREFMVSASPLRQPSRTSGPLRKHEQPAESVAGAVVVWHDATEARRLLLERRAHAETEARRALLQTVIDELPSGVYLVRGPEARLLLANRAAAAVWGAPWPQGQPMSEFLAANGIRVSHVDGRPFAPEEFATLRAVRTGEAVRHHQEIIRHPDGTSLPVLVNAVALDLRALSGSPADEGYGAAAEPGAIVVHQDVTALKEAERLKDEFIGIAAHELRSPLAVIKGFAQMLLLQTARGKGPPLAAWQMEAIQDIDQATTRLVELTEDLLDVTRLQAGRLALHHEPADLVALTRRVVTRLQVTTERHSLA